jgi:hypothetical protein
MLKGGKREFRFKVYAAQDAAMRVEAGECTGTQDFHGFGKADRFQAAVGKAARPLETRKGFECEGERRVRTGESCPTVPIILSSSNALNKAANADPKPGGRSRSGGNGEGSHINEIAVEGDLAAIEVPRFVSGMVEGDMNTIPETVVQTGQREPSRRVIGIDMSRHVT